MEGATKYLIIGNKYWLDGMKEEIGIFKGYKNTVAYFEGETEYYGRDDNGLIPIFSPDGFIPVK